MLDYFIKVLLFQALFLAVYDLFLKRETFFQWSRVYLMGTSLLAYLIPIIKVNQVVEMMPIVYQDYMIALPEILLSPSTVIEEKFNWSSFFFTSLQVIFWLGVVISTLLFLTKLYQIIQMIYNNDIEKKADYSLVFLKDKNAFSFFYYIFLGKHFGDEEKEQIIEHELVHVRQKHSLDLLLFELQKIVFWFNPFSYLFQKRIAELHEFIADANVIKESDKSSYFQNLLAQTFQVQKISFINLFLKVSLIKKRIVMLNKNKSKQIFKLKYLVLIPVLLSMLIYTSCEKDGPEQISKNEKRLITLYYGIENDRKEVKSKKEGYFDLYFLGDAPAGKRISYDKLSNEEKVEYDGTVDSFNENLKNFQKFEIFEMKDGKRALFQIVDFKGMKNNRESKDYSSADVVPFAAVEKAPIFPGCEDAEDPKKCTQLKIKDHVLADFDVTLGNRLDLDSGKKKVYVQFTIDKEGNITKVKARGPHEKLEEEAHRVIKKLPQMIPGELGDGKKVGVQYTLPISLVIE